MSRVIEPPPAAVAPVAVPPTPEPPAEPWVLDDVGQRQGRWVMDETPLERQEQGVPAAVPPVAPPAPGITHTPGAQPGQGYQYTLPTGHILRGATAEDVLKQMETALVTLAGQVNQQNLQPRAYVRPEEAPPPNAPVTPRAAFDDKRFYALLADEKPIEAMHLLMQEYYGVDDPRQIAPNADYAYSHAQKMNDRLETADFLSNNQDFPASPQSAELLLRRLDNDGVPVTRWNMETAYHQLVREGALQRVPVAVPQDYRAGYQQPPAAPVQPPASRGAGAPPPPGSQGGSVGDKELTQAEFEQLSTSEMKAYLEKHGMA